MCCSCLDWFITVAIEFVFSYFNRLEGLDSCAEIEMHNSTGGMSFDISIEFE